MKFLSTLVTLLLLFYLIVKLVIIFGILNYLPDILNYMSSFPEFTL